MAFDYQSIDLPVKEVIPEIKVGLSDASTLIIKAPTGAGKSTLVPIALLQEEWLKGQKILLLEPRRLDAKTIAMRIDKTHKNQRLCPMVPRRVHWGH